MGRKLASLIGLVVVALVFTTAISLILRWQILSVMFWTGVALIALGIMSGISGRPTTSHVFDGDSSQHQSHQNVEVPNLGQKSIAKMASFGNQVRVDFEYGIIFIISGIILLSVSNILS
ncbi:MAG TPA: hypothetical protein VHQ46_04425 [Desulfobacteria bacterium]|nr:hypothetical protein [Desulfobacteria bacterium]